MSLSFPNASRCYAPLRHCVSFWGHDSAFEIAFEVDEDVLRRMSNDPLAEESSLLQAFDRHRSQIEKVAAASYAKGHKTYYRLACTAFQF